MTQPKTRSIFPYITNGTQRDHSDVTSAIYNTSRFEQHVYTHILYKANYII